MSKNLVSIVSKIETSPTTITKWTAAFTAIVYIRLFLEQFSNQSPIGIIESDPHSISHMFLFFLAITVCISLIVSFFTKQRGGTVITIALCGLPIIWLAPTLDLIISGGGVSSMAYMFESHSGIIINFLTFFGPIKTPGITAGLHIELFIILSAVGWYVWEKRRNLLTAAWSVLFSYMFIFAMLALPGIIFTLSNSVADGSGTPAVVTFINETILNSNIPGNALHDTLAYKSTLRLFDIGFDTMVSQLFFIISFFTLIAWAWYSYQDALKKILFNARIERILFYSSLLILSALCAYVLSPYPVSFVWIDWVGFAVLIISWFCAWMYAVHINDLNDINIDKVSNPNRPLVKNYISVEIFREVGFVWLALSLAGSYIVGYYPFLMNLIFTSAYYVYSAPPLRLKRVPILSSFLISLACLATILAGFFFVSPDKILATFPTIYAVGIIVVFTLGLNIRDLKDIEGDRAAGIQTIPVLFGEYGKQVVGALLALSFLLLPMFLNFYTLYILAIPSSIIGYKLCVREPYNEKLIFALYFIFCVLTLLLISFLFTLIK